MRKKELTRLIIAHLTSQLYESRVINKLTQRELADNLMVSQSYISKVETGEKRLDVVEFMMYCHELNIDQSVLVAQLKEIINKGDAD